MIYPGQLGLPQLGACLAIVPACDRHIISNCDW